MKLLLQVIIVALIGVLIFTVYFAKNFDGLRYPDALRYAAIARNVVTGAGYIEPELWPVRLAYEERGPFYVNRARPFFPMVIAAFFGIFGISEEMAALSSGLFFVFSLVLLWTVSVTLFSERIARVTVILCALNSTVLHYSISGLTEIPFLFFLVLALFVMVSAKSHGGLFGAGVIFGIASLVRQEALFYALLSAAMLWLPRRTLTVKKAALLGGGLLVVMAPYWVWSRASFGRPFFDLNVLWFLGRTRSFPEYTIMRSLEQVHVLTFALSHPLDILRKSIRSLVGYYYLSPFRLTNPYVVVLFFIGLFGVLSGRMKLSEKARMLLSVLGVLFVARVFFITLTVPDQGIRYLVPFLGLVLPFAGGGLCFIFDLWKSNKKVFKNVALSCVLAFLVCRTAYHGLLQGTPKMPLRRGAYVTLGETITRHVQGAGLLLSNAPNRLAWYADRQTMVIPNTLEEMKRIDELIGVSGVVIVVPSTWMDLGDEWNSVIEKRYLGPDFRCVPFDSHRLHALIFVRTGR
jgi:4-amino-4-deoxy-L-arabinose transferase-like glycosyltransferase